MIQKKLSRMTLSPQEPSLFLPDTGSSSELSESDTTNGNDLSSRRDALNKFLSVSGVEFVSVSKTKFSELQQRTKINHVSKASGTIAAVLDVIAPRDAGALWEATKESKLVERKLSIEEDLDSTEELHLQALAETYVHATGWDTRRQILSIVADLVPFSRLQKFIPGITYYRVKTSIHHKHLFGRGAPVVKKVSPRMRVDSVQLDHFSTFITSPHVVQDLPFGQRHLQLSNGKIVEAPNVKWLKSVLSSNIANSAEKITSSHSAMPPCIASLHIAQHL